MDSNERHTLANREIRIKLIDPTLWVRSMGEANGIVAYARQIYLERRAKQMLDEASIAPIPEIFYRDLIIQVESAERKAKRRLRLLGWVWVFACFASAMTGSIFLMFAGAAANHEDYGVVRDVLLAIAFMILSIASFIRVKRIEVKESMLLR